MYEEIRYSNGGLFCSRGAWCHGDRVIDSYEIIIMEKGTVCLNENGREYELTAQQMLLLEPGLRHYGTRMTSDVAFYWFHFWSESPPAVPKTLTLRNAYRVLLLMRQLLHNEATPGFPQEGKEYLFRLLLIELSMQSEQKPGTGLAAKTAEWIRGNADRALRISDVAREMQYNADYLNRVFRQNFGISIKQAIDQARMEQIKALMLNSDLSLQSIAERCGFSDYKYFLKFFTYHENKTPTEFRGTFFRGHINRM